MRLPAVRLGTSTTTSVALEETIETVPSYGLDPASLMVTVGVVEPILRFSPLRVTRVVVVVGPLEGETFWMTGAATLILVYYLGAELYLIDPNVMDLSAPQAIAISAASLVFGVTAGRLHVRGDHRRCHVEKLQKFGTTKARRTQRRDL